MLIAIVLIVSIASPLFAKTIKVGVAQWPPAMGNPFGQQIQGAVHPFPGMFDALTVMDKEGRTQPNLALSWSHDGANTWTFKLRPDVRFINGEPFDAASVVAMIEWLKSPAAQRYFYAAEVKNIAGATAPDALTVAITTREPDVILPKRLSLLVVVPPKLFAEVGVEAYAQRPRATGPFVINSWGRDRGFYALEAALAADGAKSWRPSRHLTRVEFRVVPEQASRINALTTGKIDIAYGMGFEDADDLRAQGFNVAVNPIATTSAIALPNRDPKSPLADKRVRQALNYAVDREAIAKFILRGAVKPTANGIEPGVFGHDPAVAPYPYDPDKARALLAEAGHAEGFTIKTAILTEGMTELAAVFQLVAQDLAKVGVTLQLNNTLGTDWVQMWTSGDWRGAEALSANWNGATYMDAGRAVESFTCAKSGKPFFCAPDVEEIFARSNVEFDEAKREALLRQALALLHDLAPTIYLFPRVELMAASPRVTALPFRGRFIDWSGADVRE
ncbi:MAG: ABC transporter substrate-binding protein [Rhodospirillaceae bacterium]|nr:ABC transporter substrate-binding protein [Rhodospirillaceae bacterium]